MILTAILLGLLEGITEFLPVSSTGHLILASDLMGLNTPTNKTFDIVIQFGAMLLGVERKTAAEYSFFVAIPTMFGATAYDLFKSRHDLTMDGAVMIAVGFVAAFVYALFVVRAFVAYISGHGFAPFGWYRIA